MLVRPIRLYLVRHQPSRLRFWSESGVSASRLVDLHPRSTCRQYSKAWSTADVVVRQTSAARAYSGELQAGCSRQIHTSSRLLEQIDEPRSAPRNGVDRISNAGVTKPAGYGWTIVAQQGWLESIERRVLELIPGTELPLYEDPLLVVLFSPHAAADAKGLNDLVFQLLARTYRPANGNALQVHILSAIVDKVSVPANANDVTLIGDPFTGADGFSFWWTGREDLQYDLQKPSQDGAQARGSLTVAINGQAPQSNHKTFSSRFSIPLTNTTFVTGLGYTMSLTRATWENVQQKQTGAWEYASHSLNIVQDLHQQNAVLSIENQHKKLLLQTYSELAASELTPWRPAQDVSGNVIKALRGPDGRLPASAELETAITQLAPASYGTFEVWAEIRSADSHVQDSDSADFPRYARVVGGGGGWGDKRGLIALDAEPAVELGSKADHSFPELLDMGTMLPNVVEPGDQLRFVSFPTSKAEAEELSIEVTKQPTQSQVYLQENNQTTFGFGTTGNPEQDVAEEMSLQPDSSGSSQQTPPVHTIYGHFGAMSQRMFYEHTTSSSKDQPTKQHATNLPPYTYFAGSGTFVSVTGTQLEKLEDSKLDPHSVESSKI